MRGMAQSVRSPRHGATGAASARTRGNEDARAERAERGRHRWCLRDRCRSVRSPADGGAPRRVVGPPAGRSRRRRPGVRRARAGGGQRGDADRGRATRWPRLRVRERRGGGHGHGALDAGRRVGPCHHRQPARRVLHAAGRGASHRRAGQRRRDRADVVERGHRLRRRLRALQRRQDRDPPHGARRGT